MPFDLSYVGALPTRMRVIPCYLCFQSLFWPVFPVHHALTIPEVVHHCEDRHVHAYTVPLDLSKPQIVPVRDSNRHTEATAIAVYIPLHMFQLDQYLSTDCVCDTVCR